MPAMLFILEGPPPTLYVAFRDCQSKCSVLLWSRGERELQDKSMGFSQAIESRAEQCKDGKPFELIHTASDALEKWLLYLDHRRYLVPKTCFFSFSFCELTHCLPNKLFS